MVGDNVFDCSRPHVLGNPYTHIKHKDTLAEVVVKSREEAIRLYDTYFDKAIESADDFGDEFRNEFNRIYMAYKKYGVVYLGCYCKPNETCHCDIIRNKIIKRSMKEKIAALRDKKDRH